MAAGIDEERLLTVVAVVGRLFDHLLARAILTPSRAACPELLRCRSPPRASR